MQTLKIALLQTNLIWQNPEQNRKHIELHIENLETATDVLVLPEMFTTGFTMSPKEIAETMKGETINWLKDFAAKKQIAICGSLIIEENKNYYNRFVFVTPEGEITHYDKRHTFTLAGEDKVYKRGTEKVIVDYKGWKICPLVCYDLRFPVWARNAEDYDVLIYVANWPKPRIEAWDTLLKARAIENMTYCVGVNRVGVDENKMEYVGHSSVYDSLGKEVLAFKPRKEALKYVELDKAHLERARSKFKFLEDKDEFNLIV